MERLTISFFLMKHLQTLLIVALTFLGVSLFTLTVSAQMEGPYLGLEYGKATGLSDQDLRITVGQIINVSLTLLGMVAVSLMVYAGFLWMTAAGNDDQIGKAKSVMTAAVIGLVIIMSAYAITRFVLRATYQATTGYELQEGN